MSSVNADATPDLESAKALHPPLVNDVVQNFAWQNVTVTVKDRATKQPRNILSNSSGSVNAGELLAIMGPSGCGKSTLLNVLARRPAASRATVQGGGLVNGTVGPWGYSTFRRISCYVEQDDALVGSLTVRETVDFSACLSFPRSVKKQDRLDRVDKLLKALGIQNQANTLIGTPIRKGISGGQKRRVSVASQLITGPQILFLDEPTSGLDSAASYEVMSFIRGIAKETNLIVIASIHQPSTSTFQLFDKLVLLSAGNTCYYGRIDDAKGYFESLDYRMPVQINPAEYLLDLVNVDFAHDERSSRQLESIHQSWQRSSGASTLAFEIASLHDQIGHKLLSSVTLPRSSKMLIPFTLLHRSFIKSYRDVVAYGIRIAMYTGLAIMVGTVWLRLDTTQASIQPFINAIFFGSAFMSFMAVAYVPAFLEDRANYVKERANGLYVFIAMLFSCIAYWLSNFDPSATAFFTWVMWLFLDLIAAESLVVLISSLFPNFVIALALTAFANGLWMSVGGFLVTPTILNVFWRYVFHYIDYQTYVFQGMMVNEFSRRTYSCGAICACMYQSNLASQCRVNGTAVLETYGYKEGETGKWVGILLAIVVGYRVLGWIVLRWQRF